MKSWKIHLPATLAGRIEMHLADPLYNKPVYGARSELIIQLLSEWASKNIGTQS